MATTPLASIDWNAKLRHFLQTVAFCLTIAGLHYAFRPERTFAPGLVYSLSIGITTWALIDFGSHLFPSARQSGWPSGVWGKLLPVAGIASGYVIGTSIADTWFGWSTWANATQQHLLLSGFVSAVIGAIVTYYFYSKGKAAYLEQKISEANRLAAEARLKLLETQLEPHMLFNTLANLRVLIGADPARAQAMLDLPPELAQCAVPSLLLQPLVENSIQHGLEPKVEGGTLTVRARRNADTLTLEVCDTGMGFDHTDPAFTHPPSADHGFGVQQVRERLDAAFGSRATITFIASRAEGTRATLCFPLTP